MAMLDLKSALMSPLIKFKVKQDDKVISVMAHANIISSLSKPLHALMTTQMAEATSGEIDWSQDWDIDVFTAVYEFAITQTYQTPPFSTTAMASQESETQAIGIRMDEKIGPEDSVVLQDDFDGQDQWGLFEAASSKKGKRRAKLDRLVDNQDKEMLAYTNRWTKFNSRSESLKHSHPVRKDSSFDPVFHVQMYCFAERELIHALKECALAHLCSDLDRFKDTDEKDDVIVELAGPAYDNTPDKNSSDGGRDKLRELIALFLIAKAATLRNNPKFLTLLETEKKLAKDLFLMVTE